MVKDIGYQLTSYSPTKYFVVTIIDRSTKSKSPH